jgi:dephospho-CoA kinase
MSTKRQKVITIVGMPGAGKGVISTTALSHGFPVLICGDLVREETLKRGLVPTPENTGKVMLAIREEEGPSVIADRLMAKIRSSAAPVVVVEGVRSMDEVNVLRKNFDLEVLSVHASPKTRYSRLVARGRSDDPKKWDEFAERDMRELGVGIGHVIALAEEMLINENSIEDLKKAAEAVFSKVRKK